MFFLQKNVDGAKGIMVRVMGRGLKGMSRVRGAMVFKGKKMTGAKSI